jgi:hypothetical protein
MKRYAAMLALLPSLVLGQTFTVQRAVLVTNEGVRLDSASSDMQIYGTLSINGSRINEYAQICIQNVCVSKSLGGSITKLGPAGSSVTISWDDRTVDEYYIISRSPLTLFSADEDGSSVEVWVPQP